MTTPATAHRCERGARCYASERDPTDMTRVHLVGAVCDRPLCGTCELAVTRALESAPWLYRDLRNHTLIKGAAIRSEMVTTSKGSPLPLNGQALHLGEELWWLLCAWEDVVRGIAGLTPAMRVGKREGRQVLEAAQLLKTYLTAWIAAPATAFQVNTGHDPSTDAATEQSGVDAVIALLEWRSQVRNIPGLDVKAAKAVRRYEQPCPSCGVRAVTHHAGEDLMQCQNCSATQEYLPTLPREADYRPEEGVA